MRARRALSVLGAAVLATVLTGCLNLTGELSISENATITGQQRVEMNKQIVAGMGVTDKEGFQKLLDGDAALFGMTPEPSETEDEGDCPDVSVEETDTSFVAVCTYKDYTPTDEDDFAIARVGDTIEFTFTQTGTDGLGATEGTDGLASGSISLVVNFPGAISEVTGTTAAKATKVDGDTIRIAGTALESYDVKVVSAATGGTNGEPAVNPLPEPTDRPTTDFEKALEDAIAEANDDSSSTPWAAIVGGLVLLALVGGAIVFLLKRRPSAAPAGVPADASVAATGAATGAAATGTGAAAPGWYPFPGDPEGKPRYWDGTSWSDPTP